MAIYKPFVACSGQWLRLAVAYCAPGAYAVAVALWQCDVENPIPPAWMSASFSCTRGAALAIPPERRAASSLRIWSIRI